MATDIISTRDPHYIPGYTGYCPQYKYRIGDTYGNHTHKLLLDTTVVRSEKMVLSDRCKDEYEVFRPPHKDVEIVQGRFRHGDPIYLHPMTPGYEGFVPRENKILGQRFTVAATEGLSEFELSQMKDRQAAQQLYRTTQLQDARYCPKDLDDKQLIKTDFHLPLREVRPEQVAVIRHMPIQEPSLLPPRHGYSPFFSDCSDPGKFLKLGYGGHVPFGYSKFGDGHQPYTKSALCNFTSNYRQRQSTEWAPVTISRPDPPLLSEPNIIYHKHIGLIPNYQGHVPGQMFRVGKTYGDDTRDAFRWLRGDFSM